MMTDISLRTKILFAFVGLIFLSSLSTILAVIFATNTSVDAQARDKLLVGQKVFEQLLEIRTSQLFESAQVLTSDFGFKTAVLTGDQSTIESVLENHGARIGADLMMLASLDGELVASTSRQQQFKAFPFASLLSEAEAEGGLASTVVLQDKPYQILMLPIKAPIPKAWTVVGFEMDLSLARQLKELTSLEVSFSGYGPSNEPFELTTLQLTEMPEDSDSGADRVQNWKKLHRGEEEYLALVAPLIDKDQFQVFAVLSTSIEQALENFAPLKLQVLSIATLALVLSSIAGFVMSKNIIRPVNNLVLAAERISSGDYSVDILDDRFKQNEIAKLATSLDQMQKGIAGREEKILHQAHHDTLTGLPNRIALQKRVEDLLQQAHSKEVSFGLMLIDIRRFKAINDTFGYQVGDELLIAIADRLKDVLEDSDSPSRLGADEFLIVLEGPSKDAILEKFERLQLALAEGFRIDKLTIRAVFYAGLALFPEHGERTGQLLRRADIARNEAKMKRSRSQIYEPGSDEKHLTQLRLVNDLKSAIEKGQLSMFYQPKLDLKQKKITQAEALIRWIHPKLGFVSPGEFIPLAEQSGLMPALTRWVIEEVAREASAWRQKGLNVQMAVNLSAFDLANEDLSDFVAKTLQQNGMRASDFIFEVTESAMMDDPDQALAILNRLRDLGVALAVDDYGTGYSSLSQLKGMPVDELKIDMSFVLKLDESTYDQAIVQSTIEMGHKLGLTIVAEGVENYASWQLLEEWGCDKLQGYYISKPQPADDFVSWFEAYSVPTKSSMNG